MDTKEDIFNIYKLIDLLRANFLSLLFSSIFISVFFIALSFLVNVTYTSSLLLKNNNNQASNPLSGLGGQFSGLASMAGVDMGGSGGITLEQIEAQILSRDFINHLSTFDNFIADLIIPDSYDVGSKKLSYKKNRYSLIDKNWLSPKGKPSREDIYRAFKKNINITLDNDNSFLKIEYRHISPVIAQNTLNLILNEINNINRNKALSESMKTIDYLNKQLQQNSLSNITKSINSLTEIELNKLVVANVKTDFTLSVIDSANFPERKSHPRRSFIGVLTFFLSFFLFLGRVLLISALTKPKNS
jgi:uncharacterized protein involved in exopolysaccharide biosynthesis